MKKALIVVSFGTTYKEAEEGIINVEKHMQSAFSDYDFYRAFTSSMIIKKLREEMGIHIATTAQVLEKLWQEGYEEVLCQPTHVINGVEYEKMKGMLEAYKDKFKKVSLGRPLLTREEDYVDTCKIVMDFIPELKEEEAVVLMGHGTEHYANGAYSQFENMLRYMGNENIYVGTVEGFPDLDYVLKRLENKDVKKVYAMPLMIVAGDHARNDLAGDEKDSWKSIMEENNYETQILMRGLGELDAIGELFVEHAKEAEVI